MMLIIIAGVSITPIINNYRDGSVMRTIAHDQHGEARQVLHLSEKQPPPAPAPAAGQVRARVLSRPIHPGDLAGVRGLPDAPQRRFATPRIPGLEGMGVVDTIGAGVRHLRPGQRVAFFPVPGAWSELLTAPADLVVPVPEGVDDETAALMLVNPLTLLRAVEDAQHSQAGPVVQTAAGSSVGRLASAAALEHGIPLVNLVRSGPGAQTLRQRFPDLPTVSTADADWRTQVRDAAGGRGAQVVLDAVGGSLTGEPAGLLDDGGTLITYGQLGSGSTPLESLVLTPRALTVRGVSIGRWMSRTPEERAEDVAFASRLAATAPELFEVAASYDLADFAKAVGHVRRPGKSGTVLLTSPAP
ncbi:zinc-binding dehydrogenase [Streptomyces sp. NPDC049970]|uniref:alcohol dehydrogenase catalytic domain-containing protein n=1 Tax=Streptomyces sp. NPDC049970 TaxID=3155033 RepID=UPI00342423FA